MRAAEIPEAGNVILGLLRDMLCPDYVPDPTAIDLAAPWGEEQDYQVGLFLYDIQDYSALCPQFPGAEGGWRADPPMAVELSYMVYCNESRQFGGIRRDRIQAVLNEIIRAVHDHPVLERQDREPLQLSFARVETEFKIRLWGSFEKPLQPAVYLRAVPVLVESGLAAQVHPVKDRDYRVERAAPQGMEGGMP